MDSGHHPAGPAAASHLTDPATQTPVATATAKIIFNKADVHPDEPGKINYVPLRV